MYKLNLEGTKSKLQNLETFTFDVFAAFLYRVTFQTRPLLPLVWTMIQLADHTGILRICTSQRIRKKKRSVMLGTWKGKHSLGNARSLCKFVTLPASKKSMLCCPIFWQIPHAKFIHFYSRIEGLPSPGREIPPRPPGPHIIFISQRDIMQSFCRF